MKDLQTKFTRLFKDGLWKHSDFIDDFDEKVYFDQNWDISREQESLIARKKTARNQLRQARRAKNMAGRELNRLRHDHSQQTLNPIDNNTKHFEIGVYLLKRK